MWKRRVLLTLGAFAALLELLEMGRWVTIATRATWNWWYVAEYAAIGAGVITVLVLIYSEWRRT